MCPCSSSCYYSCSKIADFISASRGSKGRVAHAFVLLVAAGLVVHLSHARALEIEISCAFGAGGRDVTRCVCIRSFC